MALSAYHREEYFPPGKVSWAQDLARQQYVPWLWLYVCKRHIHGLDHVPMLFRSAFRKADVCLTQV